MTIKSIIKEMIDNEVGSVWVVLPGQVIAVDREKFTCDAKLMMNDNQIVTRIPIMTFSTGRSAIYMGMEAGDMVLVFASVNNFTEAIVTRDSARGTGTVPSYAFTPAFALPFGRFSEDDGELLSLTDDPYATGDIVRELPNINMMVLSNNIKIAIRSKTVGIQYLLIEPVKYLPDPSSSWLGKMIRLQGSYLGGLHVDDSICVCATRGGKIGWYRLALEEIPIAIHGCNFTVS